MRRIILAGAILSFMVGIARGGWLDDAIKNAGEGLGKRSVNDSASGVYDGATPSPSTRTIPWKAGPTTAGSSS